MSNENKKCGSGKFFIGAALGAIAGAVAGIVMAPKSGEETRKDIKELGDKAVKEGKEAGSKLIEKFKKPSESIEAEIPTGVYLPVSVAIAGTMLAARIRIATIRIIFLLMTRSPASLSYGRSSAQASGCAASRARSPSPAPPLWDNTWRRAAAPVRPSPRSPQ